MALPNADEIWNATVTSLNRPEEATSGGYMYRVEEIVTRGGVELAKIQMIGPPKQCGGFYFYVNRAYMDNSASWTIQATPIP